MKKIARVAVTFGCFSFFPSMALSAKLFRVQRCGQPGHGHFLKGALGSAQTDRCSQRSGCVRLCSARCALADDPTSH